MPSSATKTKACARPQNKIMNDEAPMKTMQRPATQSNLALNFLFKAHDSMQESNGLAGRAKAKKKSMISANDV